MSARPSRTVTVVECVALLTGIALWLSTPHALVGGDGLLRFESLDLLLARGQVSDVNYSMIGPLCATPFWLLGQIGPSPQWWCARFNAILFLIAALVLYWLLRDALSASTRRRFLLLLTFASMFPYQLQHFNAEVFTVVLVTVGTTAIFTRGSLWGWPCIVLGVANVPACAVGLGMVALMRLPQKDRWRWVSALAAAVCTILLENWLRRGHPLQSGYEIDHGFETLMPYSGQPEFSYPLFFGVICILFSFGKGLLYFAPGLFVPFPAAPRSEIDAARSLYRTWMAFVVGMIVIYSKWWAWYGGWYWGPRFFLFACVPASLVLARSIASTEESSWQRNLIVLLAVTLSFWVGLNGKAFGQYANEIGQEDDYWLEHLIWHVPEFSVLWRPFVVGFAWSSSRVLLLLLFAAVYFLVAWPLFQDLSSRAITWIRRASRRKPDV